MFLIAFGNISDVIAAVKRQAVIVSAALFYVGGSSPPYSMFENMVGIHR